MQQQQQQAEQIADLYTQPTRPTAHSNDQQSLAKIIRPRQPDMFHGEHTVQQVEVWLYSLEKYAEFVNIDDHQIVLFAVTLLCDGIAMWWHGVEYDRLTSILSTWSKFKRVFNTIEQYVHEFHLLMPELLDMDTKVTLFNFVQGLKYQCRLQVLMQKPFSLSEAYAYTEAYKTVEQCAKVANRHPTNFSPFNKLFGQLLSSYINQGPTPMDLDTIKLVDRQYGGSSGGGSYNSWYNDGSNQVKCFKCGERGYMRRDCRWLTKGSESRKKGTPAGLTRCDQTTRSTPSSVHEIQVPSSIQKSSSMCQKSMVEASEGGQHKEDTDHGDILEVNKLQEDCCQLMQLQACKDGSESLLLYDGSYAGKRMLVILDSGASSSYISPNIVTNLEMVQVEAREVETAGGHRLRIDKIVNVDFNLDRCSMTIKVYILDTKFDFVLGRNWLQKYTPDVNWSTDNWNVKINGETKILKPVRYLGESGLQYLLSHKQINWAIRHKEVEEVYLLHLLESDIKENKIPEELQPLVNEYQEILRDELPGLPPDRGFEHVINTGDEKPVSWLVFFTDRIGSNNRAIRIHIRKCGYRCGCRCFGCGSDSG
ncbi:hypothetical protein INT45_009766 [Circinella minor]|uniref:CCHC-type domain-containing protein n=1 Tax=Circinella minor TaxID=1195481 RepID=A0A8H7V7X4_9FUNG|nr:hypothetical protein INT45_009766 [Circinella minor]